MPVPNKMFRSLMEAHGLAGEHSKSARSHPRLNADQAKAMRRLLADHAEDVDQARRQRAAAVAVIHELAMENIEYSADDIIELVMSRAGVAAAVSLHLSDAQVALVFEHYRRQGEKSAA